MENGNDCSLYYLFGVATQKNTIERFIIMSVSDILICTRTRMSKIYH